MPDESTTASIAGQTVGELLEALGSAKPTPGGGAAAALSAAIGAGMVEMVCNLTIGKPDFADRSERLTAIRDTAGELRIDAVQLAAADATAFSALMAALRIGKDEPDRDTRIQQATIEATRVPLAIAQNAVHTIDLAAELIGESNPNVISDLGVAIATSIGAIEAAAFSVEINLPGIVDESLRKSFERQLDLHQASADDAVDLMEDVRDEMAAE